jgi:uncharacterized protein (TIGR02147 family)
MPHASPATQRPLVFDFKDYKDYIRRWIAAQPNQGHGEKSRIAKHLKCHIAYVSQVLNAQAQLSAEQADALNTLFEHSDEEADFFMLLVQIGRAGTHSLEKFYNRKITEALKQRTLLRNRIADKKAIAPEDQATYYSSWHYAALHMGVLIPGLRTPRALARHFGLSLDKTRRAIEFMISLGLIRESQGTLLPGETRLHLTDDSPMISKHHINWRMQAIQALDQSDPGALEAQDELHYSSIVSISREDIPRAREILLKAIENVRKLVRDSKDEEVCCYTVDLFGVGGGSVEAPGKAD